MSYVIDEKYDKKNIAVYCLYKKNKTQDKKIFSEVDAKWRNSLKNGKFGWLITPDKINQVKKIVDQLNNSSNTTSNTITHSQPQNTVTTPQQPTTTLKKTQKKKLKESKEEQEHPALPLKNLGSKQESKPRREQNVYRRAVSEDEQSDSEQQPEPDSDIHSEEPPEEEEEEQVNHQSDDEVDHMISLDDEDNVNSNVEHSNSESESDDEQPIISKKNNSTTATVDSKNSSKIPPSNDKLNKKIHPYPDTQPQDTEILKKKTQPALPSVNRLSNRNATRYSKKNVEASSDEDEVREVTRAAPIFNKVANDKYRKYKEMARRKPINISDDSTDQEESSSSDYPSPSPVGGNKINKINNKIKELRELEKRLGKYK